MIIITFCCCFSLLDHFVNTFKVISIKLVLKSVNPSCCFMKISQSL